MVNYKGMKVITFKDADEFGWLCGPTKPEQTEELYRPEGEELVMLGGRITIDTIEWLVSALPYKVEDYMIEPTDFFIEPDTSVVYFPSGFAELKSMVEVNLFMLALQNHDTDYIRSLSEEVLFNFMK